ncbi:MAG TPA: hypothetical protein VL346_13515 [Acidobacteriaceae bacterium]|nr:hypothetical protein [Acidobacteriaceae bacterium]
MAAARANVPFATPHAVTPLPTPVKVPVAIDPTKPPVVIEPVKPPVSVTPVSVDPTKPPIVVDPIKPPVVIDPTKPPIVVDPTKPPVVIDPTKPPVVIDPTKPPIVVDPPVKRDPGCPPLQVEDRYVPQQLAAVLSVHLAGTPSDGSRAPDAPKQGPVIWVDQGDEVLVHLESTQVRMQDGSLIVSVDLETDQTGRQPLVMAFSVSNSADASGLIATTDDLPRGNGLLAARWGHVLQTAMWASILNMGRQHASERQLAPNGVSVVGGVLQFHAGAPVVAAAPTVVAR